MKKKRLFSVTAVLCSLMLLSSCAPNDPDDDPTPTAERDKFLGTWSCKEDSKDNGSSTYMVSIKESSSSADEILIENIYNFGTQHRASAKITGNGSTFSIASQTISGNKVSGTGSMQGTSTINMNYTVNDGAGTDTVVAVLKK